MYALMIPLCSRRFIRWKMVSFRSPTLRASWLKDCPLSCSSANKIFLSLTSKPAMVSIITQKEIIVLKFYYLLNFLTKTFHNMVGYHHQVNTLWRLRKRGQSVVGFNRDFRHRSGSY